MQRGMIDVQLVRDADMSADIISEKLDVLYLGSANFQCVFTGTPTGSFKVQISNNGTSWLDYPNDLLSGEDGTLAGNQPSGSADEYMIELGNLKARFARLVYTASSGSGTLNVWAVAKEV